MSERSAISESGIPPFINPNTAFVECHMCGEIWEPQYIEGIDLSGDDEYYPDMVPVCPEDMGGLQMSDAGRVMIDIETLGLEVGSSIISIGAVKFDIDGVGEEFYRNVDLPSCEAVGLQIDAETLDWWLHQSVEAQGQLTDGVTITTALNDLAEFIDEDSEVWANSPSFDCEMLEYAYDAVDMDVPWSFYHERDFRTLKELPIAPDMEQDGVEHDALDDAKHQARVASETLSRLEECDE